MICFRGYMHKLAVKCILLKGLYKLIQKGMKVIIHCTSQS